MSNQPTLTAHDYKTSIAGLAVTIRETAARNYLTFADMDTARLAAGLFLKAGITCSWLGGNQPVLTTAAYFNSKGA